MILNLFQRFEVVLAEPFLPNSSIVALHIGILLRLTRLDIHQLNPTLCSPYLKRGTDILHRYQLEWHPVSRAS